MTKYTVVMSLEVETDDAEEAKSLARSKCSGNWIFERVEEERHQVVVMFRSDDVLEKKIPAIKLISHLTGMGLKNSKDFYEAHSDPFLVIGLGESCPILESTVNNALELCGGESLRVRVCTIEDGLDPRVAALNAMEKCLDMPIEATLRCFRRAQEQVDRLKTQMLDSERRKS